MSEMQRESLLMRILKAIGMESLAWSFRRLHCPVGKEALVLDVGSGGNPYPRANVLLDGFEDTIERYHASLVKDRPLIYGMIEKLPFKDKSFDFIIASHVLEHSLDPEAFLQEMMRVGKAGYIETPDAFFERINPFRFHRLEVTDQDGVIKMFRKPSWRHDGEIVDLYENKVKDKRFIKYLSDHPEPFYMRFYWSNTIPYEIENPDEDSNWPLPDEREERIDDYSGVKKGARGLFVKFFRRVFSQNYRNKTLDIISLLQCPICKNNNLIKEDNDIVCPQCEAKYPIRNGSPIMSIMEKQP